MFVTRGRIQRELVRGCSVEGVVPGQQADYSLGAFSIELPFYKAHSAEDVRKPVTKAKPGDRLVIQTPVKLTVKRRFMTIEAHEKLYSHGTPSFKRMYSDGDVITGEMRWVCYQPLDLDALPWLVQVYIDETVYK